MGLTQAAMILFFYFQGGTILTQTILTPSFEFCQANKESIAEDFRQNRVHIGNTDLPPDKIIPICIHVPKL